MLTKWHVLTEQTIHPVLRSIESPEPAAGRLDSKLERHFPALRGSIQDAPNYVQEWFAADTEWKVVSHKQKSHTITLWEYWAAGCDIKHLEELHQVTSPQPNLVPSEAPRAEERAPEGVNLSGNRFDALKMLNENEEDGGSFSDTTGPTPSIDPSAAYLFEAPPPVRTCRQNTSDAIINDAKSSTNTRSGPEDDEPTALTPNFKDGMDNKAVFLAAFGLLALPGIPKSRRDIDDLLGSCFAWHFSLDERCRLVRHVETIAAAKIHDETMSTFERLVSEHDHARKLFIQTRDTVGQMGAG